MSNNNIFINLDTTDNKEIEKMERFMFGDDFVDSLTDDKAEDNKEPSIIGAAV
jgi:hypothetical protein